MIVSVQSRRHDIIIIVLNIAGCFCYKVADPPFHIQGDGSSSLKSQRIRDLNFIRWSPGCTESTDIRRYFLLLKRQCRCVVLLYLTTISCQIFWGKHQYVLALFVLLVAQHSQGTVKYHQVDIRHKYLLCHQTLHNTMMFSSPVRYTSPRYSRTMAECWPMASHISLGFIKACAYRLIIQWLTAYFPWLL